MSLCVLCGFPKLYFENIHPVSAIWNSNISEHRFRGWCCPRVMILSRMARINESHECMGKSLLYSCHLFHSFHSCLRPAHAFIEAIFEIRSYCRKLQKTVAVWYIKSLRVFGHHNARYQRPTKNRTQIRKGYSSQRASYRRQEFTEFHKCASGDGVILQSTIEWLRFRKSPVIRRTSRTYTL